ncbi:DUF4190 domain-containing protein [Mycobacterium sp. CVI_P3]|uniref:DUF4190 domain-containing protein n=1 Tax=Mycobacterium pinniadriaticum TaxID=2994102 RepID=A0ABT3SCH1_9MYCO|nr:DUF4190 domain-containing protein [Mycobacterium pinniadriaticum]MCX2930776.1 DUF4190 domain-containing protein [Mycobacterium pinniadriaticum]MCX2937200.1 DUF4190 domain-containing protein [Mycobacterium pinniadriaticum]
MTASGGDSGEKPQNADDQGPSEGTYEAPPIEQNPAPPGYETPSGYEATTPPAYPGYEAPSGFPPSGYPAPSYPPPGYTPQSGYPPPAPGGFGAPGYSEPTPPYPAPQGGSGYPPPPPPPQYGGAPYPGGYGYPAPDTGTNTLAIWSLVAAVIGLLCGIGSIVGIVLGLVALNQIKQSRQGGYGLAVAGIVVGVATLIISVIWAMFAWR